MLLGHKLRAQITCLTGTIVHILTQNAFMTSEQHYQNALRADPNHVDALCSYAFLLSQIPERQGMANEYLARARDMAPNHPRIAAFNK